MLKEKLSDNRSVKLEDGTFADENTETVSVTEVLVNYEHATGYSWGIPKKNVSTEGYQNC